MPAGNFHRAEPRPRRGKVQRKKHPTGGKKERKKKGLQIACGGGRLPLGRTSPTVALRLFFCPLGRRRNRRFSAGGGSKSWEVRGQETVGGPCRPTASAEAPQADALFLAGSPAPFTGPRSGWEGWARLPANSSTVGGVRQDRGGGVKQGKQSLKYEHIF